MLTTSGFLAVLLAAASSAAAQDDSDEDFPPGLVARYAAGGRTVERVDPDVAFVWNGDAPDVRLPHGPFEAAWEGLLLVREPGEYRFHVYVHGEAAVEVEGAGVLSGGRESAGWIDGTPVTLGFGEKPFKLTYRSRPADDRSAGSGQTKTNRSDDANGAGAQLRLFWSSDSFPLEPVPANLLYRNGARPDLDRIERGRIVFEAHRCGRCHRRENVEPGPNAPSLAHLAVGTNREWIIEKVLGTGHAASSEKMPSFGFTRDEAQAIADVLIRSSQAAKLASPGKPEDEAADRRQGEILFRSSGCLACHTVLRTDSRPLGTDGPYGGGDLSSVGAKRSPEWLATWLADPQRLNADHRMPVFELSAAERRQLVLYLSSLGRGRESFSADRATNDGQSPKGAADQTAAENDSRPLGRQLVENARCAACHRIPGVDLALAGVPDLSRPAGDWEKSCIGEAAARTSHRPAYAAFNPDDVQALKAYVAAHAGPLSAESRFDRGRRALERQNCLACHERDTSKGIEGLARRVSELDEALRGQSQGLIPPALTAVGDKLVDDALGRAVSGEQSKRRLPWLFVRMPRFAHSAGDKAALVEYLIGHDRLPWRQAASRSARGTSDTDDAELLVAGHTLVGAKGFSCVACHHVGDFAPRNVALGTRGSDLLALSGHMRESYFVRWTRSPMRIVPGMEMPSFVKPVPGLLDETIDAQLQAIWKALNDPRFTVPTDPSSVEQYLLVRPGERPRIVRDVFTNPKDNGGGYVARALAVGFANGHSLLYDLDTFSVRGWYFGDFARQRTLGKSWYWDMAGVPVMTGFDRRSDFVLRKNAFAGTETTRNQQVPDATDGLILPAVRDGTNGRLLRYSANTDAVRLEYTIDFEIDNRLRAVRFTETLTLAADSDTGRTGWTRRITAIDPPSGFDVILLIPAHDRDSLGEAAIWPPPGPHPIGELTLRPGPGDDRRTSIEITCDARLTNIPAELPHKPAIPLEPETVTTVPGFDGVRLPLDRAIMPTSIAWTSDGTLAFTSLKGHVFLARDTNGDGLEDSLSVFEEGLAAPYGLLADGNDLLVAHKPEVLRLRDTDGDGHADLREVVATGWGYNDNYHDWTTGFARDAAGNLYIGTGSDYAQRERPRENAKWRGKVLRVAPDGTITPVAHGFRYPMGLAMNAAGDLFVTDNQGVQNTFNEINHIVPGGHYGVPGRWESDEGVTHLPPALQVPHPWTRSVNGIAFWPADHPSPLAGHGVGAEYDSRFLVRFTLQKVGDTYQGAAYYLSRPDGGAGGENFSGPLCVAVAPNGDLYVGSIHDSGWLGGQNTGEIVRLRPNGDLPNGIRELRATADGFDIEFFYAVDPAAATRPEPYTVSGYTREWGGAYATPDTGRHKLDIQEVTLTNGGRTVQLTVPGRKTGHVYEVTCGEIGTSDQRTLWPATAHYTLHRIPE
ncbi:MAG TPA: PQQ-dependent sugar dehydrogenase [Planctomycetaceae bacterium]|nr:PQQ-dependent sugar dehydrogenase [Planctomycetaceae bacterium]